jgi:hypothetical protein
MQSPQEFGLTHSQAEAGYAVVNVEIKPDTGRSGEMREEGSMSGSECAEGAG